VEVIFRRSHEGRAGVPADAVTGDRRSGHEGKMDLSNEPLLAYAAVKNRRQIFILSGAN